jgi:sialate O-acetylesterase
MSQEAHFAQEQAWVQAHAPEIYYFLVPEQHDGSPTELTRQDAWPTSWQRLTVDNLGNVSAVAYYAAKRYLISHPDTVFGMVIASKGGTSASSWIPESDLDSPLLQALYQQPYHTLIQHTSVDDLYQAQLDFNTRSAQYWQKRHHWLQDHPDKTRAEMKAVVGHTPWPPPMTPWSYRRPSTLFYSMILPLAEFQWDAIIWYQGEEDTLYGQVYADLLTRLIHRCRQLFSPEIPWYLIQLPAYREAGKDWSAVRLAQLRVSQQVPQVHLVSGVDVGDPDNIHPVDKQPLGERVGHCLTQQRGTPIAQIERVSPTETVLKVSHAQTLTAHQQPTMLVNHQRVSVELMANHIVIAHSQPLQHLAYGLGNVPDIMITNENGEPLSPFEWFL